MLHMSNSTFFEESWTQFKASLPPGAHAFKADLESHAKAAFMAQMNKMDLVHREEFDIQCAVLQRAIARIKTLEKKLISDQPSEH